MIVHIKIAILIGTIITMRRCELSNVPNSNIIEQIITIIERFWSSHRAVTRKKYAITATWESAAAWIRYFSHDRWVNDNAYISIDVAHKYQKYRFWSWINDVVNHPSYCKNHAAIHMTATSNPKPAISLLYGIYILLWSIKTVKQSAIFFCKKSLINVSWPAFAYIWRTDSLTTSVFFSSGIYDLL